VPPPSRWLLGGRIRGRRRVKAHVRGQEVLLREGAAGGKVGGNLAEQHLAYRDRLSARRPGLPIAEHRAQAVVVALAQEEVLLPPAATIVVEDKRLLLLGLLELLRRCRARRGV
jgi:hypothetical protein